MARNYLVNLDMNKNEIQNVVAQKLATDPVGAVAGQFYYNTQSNQFRVFNGSKWIPLVEGGSVDSIQGLEEKLEEIKQEITTKTNKVKEDLVNSASGDYDTFKEIENLIKRNASEIERIQTSTKKYSTEIGDGVALEHTITHNLNSRDVIVQVRTVNAPYEFVLVDVECSDENTVKIKTARAIQVNNKLKVIVIG